MKPNDCRPIGSDSTKTRVLLAALFLLPISCAETSREEVISRFEGGEKQVVAVYRGSGTNEQLVERHTYNSNGDLVLLEDLESGTTSTWQDLNPELDTPRGLQEAMQGDWYSRFDLDGVVIESHSSITGTDVVTVYQYDYLNLDDEFDFDTSVAGTLEFLADRRVRMTPDEDAAESLSFAVPTITTTSRIEFRDQGAYQTWQTSLIDGRITIEEQYGGILFRDRERALAYMPSAEEMERLTTDIGEAWRLAIEGDERLMTEFPEFYEMRVGEE